MPRRDGVHPHPLDLGCACVHELDRAATDDHTREQRDHEHTVGRTQVERCVVERGFGIKAIPEPPSELIEVL